jgi:hypothetical protein
VQCARSRFKVFLELYCQLLAEDVAKIGPIQMGARTYLDCAYEHHEFATDVALGPDPLNY